MNIAIIDDSNQDRVQLHDHVDNYCRNSHLNVDIRLFSDSEDFLKIWSAGTFDLIFIDIFMGEINGISLAEIIRQTDQNCLIIFSTSSSDYAVYSYRLRAFDYLVKPYSYELLAEAMRNCFKIIQCSSYYIEIKESRTMVRILINDIIFADYYNHYILIHTHNRVVKSYMRFQDFAPSLLYYPQFLNCYRNCIVNMDRVASLEKNDFLMDNGERIPIARDNRREIRQLYADYEFQKLNQAL